MEIEHAYLVSYASYYDGLLEKELDQASAEAKLEAEIKEKQAVIKKRPEEAEKIHASFLQLVKQMEVQVQETGKWISALEESLRKAQSLLEKLPAEDKVFLLKEGMAILRKNWFPVEKYPKLTRFLARRPADLREVVKAAGLDAPSFFERSLPQMNESGLYINEINWLWLVEMVHAAGAAPPTWDALIELRRRFIANEKNQPWMLKLAQAVGKKDAAYLLFRELFTVKFPFSEKTWPGIIKIAQAAGENAWIPFRYGLSDVDLSLLNDWPMVVKGLVKMCRAVTGREEMIALFKGAFYAAKDFINKKTFPGIVDWSIKTVQALGIQAENLASLIDLLKESGLIKTAEDFENMETILANPKVNITTYRHLTGFLCALLLNPDKMKEPLKNLIANLAVVSFSVERSDIEQTFPRIKTTFGLLLRAEGLDVETKYLLRKLASLLPLGGDAGLINRVRQEAIVLSTESINHLENIRQKIHNFPGREDVEIISAYLHFLETGSLKELEEQCARYKIKLNSFIISQMHSELKNRTLEVTKSLLANLRKLWQLEPGVVRIKRVDLECLDEDVWEMGPEATNIFEDIINKMMILEEFLRDDKKEKAAHIIGDLRFDVRVLESMASGDLKAELSFLEIFLESVELQIHPEALKKIRLETWEGVADLIKLVIQKSFSLAATYHFDRALSEAVYRLENFERTKDLKDLEGSLDYFAYGINYLNEKVVRNFKEIFRQKIPATQKELEELVSPFYRTGPIFQLDQLIGVLRNAYESGKIKEIIKETPRPVFTHLRERLYQRIGLGLD
ncbi:MAG: hypothetical protein AB1668_03290 [Nanoarchaeota archaeon]